VEFVDMAFGKMKPRTIKAIASDIRYAFKNERNNRLKIGRFLREAEALIAPGLYETWIVDQQFGFDLRTARRYRELVRAISRLSNADVPEDKLSNFPDETIYSIGKADDASFATVVDLFKANAPPTRAAINHVLSPVAKSKSVAIDDPHKIVEAVKRAQKPQAPEPADTKAALSAVSLLEQHLLPADFAKFMKLVAKAPDAFITALLAIYKSEAA